MEKLNIREVEGIAKVGGTILGIGGAMILTFYKGFKINIWSTHFDLLHNHTHVASFPENAHSQLLGSLLGLGSCISYSLWLIAQAKLTKLYPCHYSNTALMCLMAAIQALVFSMCVERDWSHWKLGWNIRLLTVAYAGIAGSGATVTLISWCVHMKGPLYVSIFSPLLLVLIAIVGSFCLNENLHLGSVIGTVLIVCGLYTVLWGKSKEMKKIAELTHKDPKSIDILVTTPKHKSGSENHDTHQNNNKDAN